MKKRNIILFIVIGLLLLTVAGIQYYGPARQFKNLKAEDVGLLLPSSLPGWTVEDKPLADSPELLQRVESLLSFDSAMFRVYRQGPTEISIYMAYWVPGKTRSEIVDEHTPDICWVGNGWNMENKPALENVTVNGVNLAIPNHREFEIQGHRLSVLYWHLDGQNIKLSNQKTLPIFTRVKQRIKQMFELIDTGPKQQFFIRISSNGKISEQLDTDPIQASLELIARTLKGEEFYSKEPKIKDGN